jgi:hypothetical protein
LSEERERERERELARWPMGAFQNAVLAEMDLK